MHTPETEPSTMPETLSFPEHWSRTPTWKLLRSRTAIREALPQFSEAVRADAERILSLLDAYLNPILSREPTTEEIEEAASHA